MTIRGLLIWYLCGVTCVGVAGATAYRVLGRQHAPATAEAAAPQAAPMVLAAAAESLPQVPTPAAVLAPKPRRIAAAKMPKGVAEALPLPPEPPPLRLPPLRRHTAVASAHQARDKALPHAVTPDASRRDFAAAPPPPFPYYPGPVPAHYASAQPYYFPYYLYYRSY